MLKHTRYYMYVAGPNEIINAIAPPLQRSIPRSKVYDDRLGGKFSRRTPNAS